MKIDLKLNNFKITEIFKIILLIFIFLRKKTNFYILKIAYFALFEKFL